MLCEADNILKQPSPELPQKTIKTSTSRSPPGFSDSVNMNGSWGCVFLARSQGAPPCLRAYLEVRSEDAHLGQGYKVDDSCNSSPLWHSTVMCEMGLSLSRTIL